MRDIKRIVLHESDSAFGDAKLINSWHKERGFVWTPKDKEVEKYSLLHIGYHEVILNGRISSSTIYVPDLDGVVEYGRPYRKSGAHAYGANTDSIGICLVGKGYFTKNQLQTLYSRVLTLCCMFDIEPTEATLIGHNETKYEKSRGKDRKRCPELRMDMIRTKIQAMYKHNQAYMHTRGGQC